MLEHNLAAFSVGSMLALDRPFIGSSSDSALETCEGFCLEYGSATQLYLVPFLQHEERVSLATVIHLRQSNGG